MLKYIFLETETKVFTFKARGLLGKKAHVKKNHVKNARNQQIPHFHVIKLKFNFYFLELSLSTASFRYEQNTWKGNCIF